MLTPPLCSAQSRLEVIDQRAEPTLQPLEVIKTSDLICHLWQQYVNVAIIPLTSSSVTIRREMLVFNNQTVSRLEGVANALLQRIADGVFLISLRARGTFLWCIVIRRCRLMAISSTSQAEEERLQA